MIDNYLLEELVVFSETKTLAKTADQLMITQPTVTRGMQKLERELNVKLFHRQANKITLTKTGQLAAQEAKELLDANQRFITHIQNFEQAQQTIKVGSIAPGPLIVATQLVKDFNLQIDHTFVKSPDVIAALENNQYSCCFTNQEIQTDKIESLYIGKEHLFVNLDQFMYLAGKQKLSFKELKGLSFVVLNDIGPWKEIIQNNIPDAKFLYQSEWDALREITNYSNFPYFTTNVTRADANSDANDRVEIPITDSAAIMPFYAAYLKTQRNRLQLLLRKFTDLWHD
jgi:DNA-binding transcriptional LysR family regulator